MQTIPDIIDGLGGPSALARDLGHPIATVTAWKHRERIPDRYWSDLIAVAKSQRIKLTLEAIMAANCLKAPPRPAPMRRKEDRKAGAQ
jgi:hypothetical protein